jgi:hypothetical protein
MVQLLKSLLQGQYKSRKQYVCYSATKLDEIWSYITFKYYKGYY